MKLKESYLNKIVISEIKKVLKEDSGIHIDPKNKGKFTKTQKETGKSTEELTHSKNPLTRKRANFARMAKRHFKPLKEEQSELDILGCDLVGLEDEINHCHDKVKRQKLIDQYNNMWERFSQEKGL